MRKVFGLVLILIVVIAAVIFYRDHRAAGRPSEAGVDVGLIQLLQSPAEYDGKKVRVTGYMHQADGDSAIYLHPEDTLPANALWIDVPAGQTGLGGHFVVYDGVFDSSKHGQTGAFGGELVKVSRVQLVP